jgi:thiol-disulfide isomerase/thioredoxin
MNKPRIYSYILLGLGLMLVGAGLSIRIFTDEPRGASSESEASRKCVEPAAVSYSAPELELRTLDHLPISIEAYRGRTVLLNAWATWCPPCLAELPDLEAFYQEHRDEDFVLIGVNIGESLNVVERFIEQNPLSYPILLDPDEQTLRALNTIALPYTIVIDQAGNVRLAWSGATCLENLETNVTPILRQ